MKKIAFLFLATLTIVSCTEEVVVETNPKQEIIITEVNEDLAKGFQHLQTVCFSCHSPNAGTTDKVAPTMAEVKQAYLENTDSKEMFVSKFVAFVSNPTAEVAIIKHAPPTYGVMPKFEFSKEELTQVANYVYQSSIEKADWFAGSFESEKAKFKPNDAALSYVALGKKFALSTKSVLGKNLKGAIKNKGTENAVSFCNESAYSLTDSMAVQLHAGVKRVSDQARNPINQANATELAYIQEGKKRMAEGKKVKPLVQEIEGKMIGYYPITTNKMCLQCHGTPNTQIKPETLAKIQLLYPSDAAKGYDTNQLRGIWVIEMDKK
jgi:cytochrome c551/c552